MLNIEKRVPLGPLTSYQIGGPAEQFAVVTSPEELVAAVGYARSNGLPYFLLGCGANILISDQGFGGLVIHNRANEIALEGAMVRAGSGAVMKDVIEVCRQAGLSGLEHFAGIPSTVGGALWQNLHFLSVDRSRTMFIEEVLQSAKVLLADGEVKEVGVDFFQFGYDDSILHHREIIVLEAVFALESKPIDEIERTMAANLAWRAEKHPSEPSCGSVFKKIEGIGAGRLIDEAGLKGHRIGGAQVSSKHANFIVNLGGATASDVYGLIKLVQQRVEEKSGYRLEIEIRLVGEF